MLPPIRSNRRRRKNGFIAESAALDAFSGAADFHGESRVAFKCAPIGVVLHFLFSVVAGEAGTFLSGATVLVAMSWLGSHAIHGSVACDGAQSSIIPC